MLLTPRPTDILTHEQNILWSVSEIRKILVSQPENTTAPRKIIEAEGYYASEVVSIQEISPPASYPRHVVRLLMPIAPGYYGASQPVWKFVGALALGLDVPIGMDGLLIPNRVERIRLNPAIANGTIERKDTAEGIWTNTWGGSAGVEFAYFVPSGPAYGIWMRQIDTYPGRYHQNVPGIWSWSNNTLAEYDAALATPGTVRL